MKAFLVLTLALCVNAYSEDCQYCASNGQNENAILAWSESFVKEQASKCEQDRAAAELLEEEKILWSNSGETEVRTYGKDQVIKLSGKKVEHALLDKLLGRRISKKETGKIKECNTVLCALSKIYKSELVARYSLNLYKKAGYFIEVGLLYKDWSVYEAKNLYDAVSMLPQNFHHLKNLEKFCKPRVYPLKPFATGDAISKHKRIRIGETVSSLGNKTNMRSNIIHEIAHMYDFSEKPEFDDIGWKNTKIKSGNFSRLFKKKKEGTRSISKYGSKNPIEDFAESVTGYIFNSEELKTTSPEKFDFIKNIFSGRGYFTGKIDPNESYADMRSRYDATGSMLADCIGDAGITSDLKTQKIYFHKGLALRPLENYGFRTVNRHSKCFSEKYDLEKQRLKNSYYSCNDPEGMSYYMNEDLERNLAGVANVANTIIEKGSCSEDVRKQCSAAAEFEACVVLKCLQQDAELRFGIFSKDNQTKLTERLTQKLKDFIRR